MSESLITSDGWTPVMVSWAEDPHPDREVLRSCRRCFPFIPGSMPGGKTTMARGGLVPLFLSLVSPNGIAHHAERGDTTDCGKDCTGPEWWHRL